MWGQVRGQRLSLPFKGIIPTRVGTSLRGDGWVLERKDHPHACGDKAICSVYRHGGIGSSPRVWGQASLSKIYPTSDRIIPTRVGTSVIQQAVNDYRKDHPHACGDKTKEIKENSGFAKSTA